MDFKSLRIVFLLPLLWVDGVWAVPCQFNDRYGVLLTEQSEVDALGATGCTNVVGGQLRIANDGLINTLDPLVNLAEVGGDLSIQGGNLSNIDGLRNITRVQGDLRIYRSPGLPNVDGLVGLTTVGGSISLYMTRGLQVDENTNLTNIDGLRNVTSVGGGISIWRQPALKNVDGLIGLTEIGDSLGRGLTIGQNPSLRNLDGLSNLTTVRSFVEIEGNALENLDGLSSLTSVGSWLADNPAPRGNFILQSMS